MVRKERAHVVVVVERQVLEVVIVGGGEGVVGIFGGV